MLWFLHNSKEKKDIERKILDFFPDELHSEVIEVINVLPFENNSLTKISQQYVNVFLNNELLKISDRVYFNEPSIMVENNLNDMQKKILHCIFLRHHNGYIRQKRLEFLLNANEYFVIPFTSHLIGEYVIEILNVLNKHINQINLSGYNKFFNENPSYWKTIQSRVISYWNEYYRRYTPKDVYRDIALKDINFYSNKDCRLISDLRKVENLYFYLDEYIGQKIVNRIKGNI